MKARPLIDLSNTGLLWMINRNVFHPRGYALGLSLDENLEVNGWVINGDGTEPYTFDIESDKECFAEAEAFLAGLKDEA